MRGGSLEEQVERLIAHCGYTNVSREEITEGSEVVILEQTSPSVELYTCARERGTTVVILHPNSDNERRSMCQKIMRGHRSTTIERFDYIVIFNNHLPKQHFKL